MKLQNGTVVEAEEFKKGEAIFIKSDDNRLVKINPEGEISWFYECEGNVSDPVVSSSGKVYFSRKDIGVTCLDSDGEVEWEENGIGFVNSPPSIGPDGLIYVRTYEGVVALEP